MAGPTLERKHLEAKPHAEMEVRRWNMSQAEDGSPVAILETPEGILFLKIPAEQARDIAEALLGCARKH